MLLETKASGANTAFTIAVIHLLLLAWVESSQPSKPHTINQNEDAVGECLAEGMPVQNMNIGLIQGSSHSSPCEGKYVEFQGVVVGFREDQNSQGEIFYTMFVQDAAGSEDMDLATSDGIAVFLGTNPPTQATGDLVKVSGRVQEYYGLTEIEHRDQAIETIVKGVELPAPIQLSPPADNRLSFDYFERLEGMIVSLDSGIVVGATYRGCGLAVVDIKLGLIRIIATSEMSSTGQIINILNASDIHCDGFPMVSAGDVLAGIKGPLTFEFDQFKVIQQPDWLITSQENPPMYKPIPVGESGQFTAASFNVNDFFATPEQTDEILELDKLISVNKMEKIAYTIQSALGCPTLIGLQEVENISVLEDLAQQLIKLCGFLYEFELIEGPDIRGIDNALMVDPRLVTIEETRLRQECSEQVTEVIDREIDCPDGEWPLFSRPPLEASLRIGDEEFVIFINHFKSKRGGAIETAQIRLAQANYLSAIVEDTARSHPTHEIIVLGDLNDFEDSLTAQELVRSGQLTNILKRVPEDSRYTYSFGGASQLVDFIFISQGLLDKVIDVSIAHVNADFPYGWGAINEGIRGSLRSSDHDVPAVIFQLGKTPAVEPREESTPTTTSPAPKFTPDFTPVVSLADSPIQQTTPAAEVSASTDQTTFFLLALLLITLVVGALLAFVATRRNQNS